MWAWAATARNRHRQQPGQMLPHSTKFGYRGPQPPTTITTAPNHQPLLTTAPAVPDAHAGQHTHPQPLHAGWSTRISHPPRHLTQASHPGITPSIKAPGQLDCHSLPAPETATATPTALQCVCTQIRQTLTHCHTQKSESPPTCPQGRTPKP